MQPAAAGGTGAMLFCGQPARMPVVSAALQPIKTHSPTCGVWRLQLQDRQAKHTMFHPSSSFRQQTICLDDDLTKQPLLSNWMAVAA